MRLEIEAFRNAWGVLTSFASSNWCGHGGIFSLDFA